MSEHELSSDVTLATSKWFAQAGSLDGSSDDVKDSIQTSVESVKTTEESIRTIDDSEAGIGINQVGSGPKKSADSFVYRELSNNETFSPAISVTQEAMKTRCKTCGAQNKADAHYCYACGADLRNSSPSVIQQNFIKNVSFGNQLSSLSKYVESLEKLLEEEEGIKARIKEPRRIAPISKGQAMLPFILPGSILGGISFLVLIAFLSGADVMPLFFLYFIQAVILIGIGFPVGAARERGSARVSQAKFDAAVKEQADLNARLIELDKIMNEMVGKIQELMTYDGRQLVIPENYFYSDAIQFFADRIVSGRSCSLAEAMDAYDAHIHRMKLEQTAMEAAEYQRQSANNLAAIQREQAAMRRQGAVNTALHVANTLRHW